MIILTPEWFEKARRFALARALGSVGVDASTEFIERIIAAMDCELWLLVREKGEHTRH